MKKNRWLLLTMAALLVFVVIGLQGGLKDVTGEQQSAAASLLRSEFDYFISDMELERFLPDGTHNYRIDADRVTHYPAGDYSVLENPVLNWQQSGQASWQLGASTGIMQKDPQSGQQSLLLQQQVLAERQGSGTSAIRIETEELLAFPDTRELNTEKKVLLTGEYFQQSGTGMHARLAQNEISLLSGVRGHHE